VLSLRCVKPRVCIFDVTGTKKSLFISKYLQGVAGITFKRKLPYKKYLLKYATEMLGHFKKNYFIYYHNPKGNRLMTTARDSIFRLSTYENVLNFLNLSKHVYDSYPMHWSSNSHIRFLPLIRYARYTNVVWKQTVLPFELLISVDIYGIPFIYVLFLYKVCSYHPL
jgi:hypothetical protein